MSKWKKSWKVFEITMPWMEKEEHPIPLGIHAGAPLGCLGVTGFIHPEQSSHALCITSI